MVFLIFIGVVLIAVTTGLLARAFALPRLRMGTQLRQIETYGFNAVSEAALPAPRPPLGARLNRLAERVGRSTQGSGWRAPVEGRSLRAAGVYSVTPEAFHGYRVTAAVVIPGFLVLVSVLSPVTLAKLLEIGIAFWATWFLPAAIVRSRAQRRMDEIDRSLPELIDVLTATMEAGLGFAGSLQLVAERFSGPLGQELRLTFQEQRMGLSTEQALSHLLDRCDTPSVRAFVRAVIQGESLGVSVATMMRNLAGETRKRRRHNAHTRIQKAPVKMLFPLVFLIFPALLIVLLYPALTQVLQQLGGQ
jgi:tight adherence protein C